MLLYFHVFNFPVNDTLTIPGLAGEIYKAYTLSDKNKDLVIIPNGNNPEIDLSGVTPDSLATVVAVEDSKDMKVYNAPEIEAEYDIFTDTAGFGITTDIDNAVIHYTTDGSVPTEKSSVAKGINKVSLPGSFTLKAVCFINGKPVSGIAEHDFTKETPIPSVTKKNAVPGLQYTYYEGQWSTLPDFKELKVAGEGICKQPGIRLKKQDTNYGFVFTGYLAIPKTGVYRFQLTSDDGSLLRISGKALINDGLHAMITKTLDVALEKGFHPVKIEFFQAGGGDGLTLNWKYGDNTVSPVPVSNWVH